MQVLGCDFKTAVRTVLGEVPSGSGGRNSKPNGNDRTRAKTSDNSKPPVLAHNVRAKLEKKGFHFVKEFYYQDNLRKVRFEKSNPASSKPEKTFLWEHRENGKWWSGKGDKATPLYANKLFWERDQLGLVLGFEGEEKADLAGELGFPAFSYKGLRPEHCSALAESDIVLWPDKDGSGDEQARDASRLILASACARRLRLLTPPTELSESGDIRDWAASGGTEEKLLELVAGATVLTAADVAAWGEQTEKPGSEPVGVLLSEVKPEKVEWLWQDRIPLGKITVVDGDPDLGKSLLTLDIAARITTNRPMPRATTAIDGGVVLLTAEDGLADTVVPRLIAAGGDRNRIVALKYVPDEEGEKTVSNIPVDLPIVQAAIERVGAKLLIVDVLMAYLPSEINSYRDQDVRLALAPLAQLANRTRVAVIIIRHLNKNAGGAPLYRGGGSIGIIGAARAGLLVARDPDDSDLIVLARNKGNLGRPVSSLSYKIKESSDGAPYISWEGESAQTAASLLAATGGSDEERSALAEAKDFLRQELAGGRQLQKDLKKAARKAGIKDATLRRAKLILGVKSVKDGFVSEWHWELLNIPKPAEDAHIQEMSTFGGNGDSNFKLAPEKSVTSAKALNVAHPEDAQEPMSIFDTGEESSSEDDWGEL